MATTTAAHRDLARWLLGHEMRDRQDLPALVEAAETTCQKLSQRLARLVTAAGSRALIARALHLASADFPFLAGVQAGSPPERYLEGLGERVQGVEPARAREGVAMVLASVLGLLATFIGDELTLRLVRDVWPDAQLDGAGPREQEAQETRT